MSSWKAFDLKMVPGDDMDYVQMQISSSDNPHRPLQQMLKKIKKPIRAEEQQSDVEQFTRQIIDRVGSYTESYFKQKPPTTYLTNNYFSMGLTNTENKCHIIVNMMENSPIYVYECDREERHRYVRQCNINQILVNKSFIESHFTLKEVSMSANYIAPVGTVYFFFTISPSLFILESIVPPFDMTVNTRHNSSRKNSLRRDSDDSSKSKEKESKCSKRKPVIQNPTKNQHEISDTTAAATETQTYPEPVLTLSNQEKHSEEYCAETIWELMMLIKHKDLEILALKEEKERLELDSRERFRLESANKNLVQQNRNMVEWNCVIMKIVEDMEKVNKELELRIKLDLEDLSITSDPESQKSCE